MDGQHIRQAMASNLRRDLVWADDQERILQESIRREREDRATARVAAARGDLHGARGWWVRSLGLLRPHRPAL